MLKGFNIYFWGGRIFYFCQFNRSWGNYLSIPLLVRPSDEKIIIFKIILESIKKFIQILVVAQKAQSEMLFT